MRLITSDYGMGPLFKFVKMNSGMTVQNCHYSFCVLRNKTGTRSQYFIIRFVSTK